MAVFIALFFQVLFVFFAMAINVGMVVHDKINLQNAVDLAAYYGAARQAEILNQIAHINYQMRQNYKLFVWRYRVLGTIGLNNHPYNLNNPTSTLQAEDPVPDTEISPVVCVSHYYWKEFNDLDSRSSMCKENRLFIPNIQPPVGGSGFLPGFSDLERFTEMAKGEIRNACLEAGILNWRFAAGLLAHFRVEGLMRKRMIKTLANNLSSPGFADLRNESVETGVRNTFEKNLTNSNFNGSPNFEYFNSMTEGQCADPNYWLPEIQINPVIMFSDFSTTLGTEDCSGGLPVYNRAMGTGRRPYNGLDNLPSGLLDGPLNAFYGRHVNELGQHWAGEPSAGTDLHSSIGFEKNPWCMVYTGVKATTQVRKPFSPTGGTVTLQARGFAKPFGGRVGPWYGRQWPQGSPNSVATTRDQMVDRLLPSRDVPGGGGTFDPKDDVANYSRFPGDTLGFNSRRALTEMIFDFKSLLTNHSTTRAQAPLAWRTLNHLGGLPNLQNLKDSLSRDVVGEADSPARLRPFELAAVSPNVFDAFYYSIEPSYFNNYFGATTTNNGALFSDTDKIYDIGSNTDANNPAENDIRTQIAAANQYYEGDINYVIKDWQNLLTGWHQKAAVDYDMDPSQFGRCNTAVTNQSFPNPGNCIDGGRTGSSIKNVSRDFLMSSDHELGGGGAGGPILNPPTF